MSELLDLFGHGGIMSTKQTLKKRRAWIQAGIVIALFGAGGLVSAQAQGMMGGGMMGGAAASPPALAPTSVGQYGCMACHSVSQRKVGPAFSWVAWRFRNQPDAVARVGAFIEHGGHGSWGGIMPDLNVPPAQAREIAIWILSLPPHAPPGS